MATATSNAKAPAAFTQDAKAAAAVPFVSKPESAAAGPQWLKENAAAISKALDSMNGGGLPEIAREALQVIPQPKSNALQLAEFTNARYRINVDASIDLRLLHRNPTFWSALAGRGLQKFDDIRAVADDENAVADFLVIDADDKFVDAELRGFHRVQRRARVQGETTWLKPDERLKWIAATATERGGCVIIRGDGKQIMDSGLPFKDEEAARRFYKDAAWNRTDQSTQYFPR